MSNKTFGQYLKAQRLKNSLTIKDLARLAGMSPSYLSRIERGLRGTPSASLLKKLARPLGLKQEELLIAAGYLEKKKGSYQPYNNASTETNSVKDPDIKDLWEEMQDLNREEKKGLFFYLKAIKLQRQKNSSGK